MIDHSYLQWPLWVSPMAGSAAANKTKNSGLKEDEIQSKKQTKYYMSLTWRK